MGRCCRMSLEIGMHEIPTSLTRTDGLWTMRGTVQQLLNVVSTRSDTTTTTTAAAAAASNSDYSRANQYINHHILDPFCYPPVRCTSGWLVECQSCNREVAGSNLSRGYFAPRSTQPSIPLGSVNEYQLRLGRQRQVWLIPIVDERVGVQVKLWNPLRTRAISERFCDGASLRRGAISSVCTLPLVTFCSLHSHLNLVDVPSAIQLFTP